MQVAQSAFPRCNHMAHRYESKKMLELTPIRMGHSSYSACITIALNKMQSIDELAALWLWTWPSADRFGSMPNSTFCCNTSHDLCSTVNLILADILAEARVVAAEIMGLTV